MPLTLTLCRRSSWAWAAVVALGLLGAIVVLPVSSALVPGPAPTPMTIPSPATYRGIAAGIPAAPVGSGAAVPRERLARAADDLDDDDDDDNTVLIHGLKAGLPCLPLPAVKQAEGVTTLVPHPSRFLVRPQLLTRFGSLP
jgi:hypothetical protein